MDLMNVITTEVLDVIQWKKIDQVQLFSLCKPKKKEGLFLSNILYLIIKTLKQHHLTGVGKQINSYNKH